MAQQAGQGVDKGSAPSRGHQAVAKAAWITGLLGLAGCVGSPAEGPMEFFQNAFGQPLQGRPLPPGAADAYPNLASVPPPPAPGDPSAREALSRALADARGQSREPVVPGGAVPDLPAGAEGSKIIPSRPPAPPRLTSAPAIRPSSPEVAPDAPQMPADPGTAPALPPSEFLAPAPPSL